MIDRRVKRRVLRVQRDRECVAVNVAFDRLTDDRDTMRAVVAGRADCVVRVGDTETE